MGSFNFSAFAKMYEELKRSIRDPQIYVPKVGLMSLKLFIDKIEDFKNDLKEEGKLWEDSGYDLDLRKIEYPLKELEVYLADPKKHRMDGEDALIFSEYIWLTFLGVYNDYQNDKSVDS